MPRNPEDDRNVVRALGPRGEAYIEYKQVGQTMKVTAIDAETGVEVVIMGPVSASRNDLQRVAVRKLKVQIDKEKKEGKDTEDDPGNDEGSGPKGWIA